MVLFYFPIRRHSGHVFRYLTLQDILLTERYKSNEGLLPWYFFTSPLEGIQAMYLDILTLQDILLTERYKTNEGLLP